MMKLQEHKPREGTSWALLGICYLIPRNRLAVASITEEKRFFNHVSMKTSSRPVPPGDDIYYEL